MPIKEQRDPRKNFPVRYLPWLLGGIMLAVYLATINPWITLLNLGWVAEYSGWNWQPQLSNPLLYLTGLLFHLAPAGQLPLVLNVFSALCSATTLGLLARCVALLPHDRLEIERLREQSDFSFLTGPLAIVPPIAAVALLGQQLTFWEHATNFTGESLELLLFAWIIWQLMEYRLDELPRRIYLAGFAYGAGIAEHWSFFAYFPVFVAAIIWLRGMDFFNRRFLSRLIGSGFGGCLLLLLLPLVTLLSGKFPVGFWEALRPELGMDSYLLRSVTDGGIWRQLCLVSLGTLLPILMLSIRWSSHFGDTSGASKTLVNYLFCIGNLGFFALCAWAMFDPPLSPKHLSLAGASGLTLYYLAALSLGYFCGFALLVFGREPIRKRNQPQRPEPLLPNSLMWLCPVVLAGMLATVPTAVILLGYKNAPIIRAENADTLLKYARFATQNLPPGGAILMADDDALYQRPVNGFLIEAMLAREGKWQMYPVVGTAYLKYSEYLAFLHERYPAVWPQFLTDKKPLVISPQGMFQIMVQLSKSNSICYLNPSFGYYFEYFYQEPHGLTYAMKPLPKATLLPPALDTNLVHENEHFWSEVIATMGPRIDPAVGTPGPARALNLGDRLLAKLHITGETNQNAVYAGTLCSLRLNDWGVRLQQAGELNQAASNFLAARRFNPDNDSAAINLEFNRHLREGTIPRLDPTRAAEDYFGKSQNWQQLMRVGGPIDEISFDYDYARVMAVGADLSRQAISVLARLRQLAPDRYDVRHQLASAYLRCDLPDLALEALADPQRDPGRFSLSEADQTDLSMVLARAYFEKRDKARGVQTLESEVARHPDDVSLAGATVKIYLMAGLYTNALTLIDRQLEKTPDDPKWVVARGAANFQSHNYDAAIASFTRALALSTNDPTVRYNRGLAYLYGGRLNEARTDLLELQSLHTNSVPIAYGLGEIAWRQHDTNEAIRNYGIYLTNVRTNTPEATNVMARLQQLQK